MKGADSAQIRRVGVGGGWDVTDQREPQRGRSYWVRRGQVWTIEVWTGLYWANANYMHEVTAWIPQPIDWDQDARAMDEADAIPWSWERKTPGPWQRAASVDLIDDLRVGDHVNNLRTGADALTARTGDTLERVTTFMVEDAIESIELHFKSGYTVIVEESHGVLIVYEASALRKKSQAADGDTANTTR